MLGAIIGDIVGSVYEFNNYRAKDFTPFFHRRTLTNMISGRRAHMVNSDRAATGMAGLSSLQPPLTHLFSAASALPDGTRAYIELHTESLTCHRKDRSTAPASGSQFNSRIRNRTRVRPVVHEDSSVASSPSAAGSVSRRIVRAQRCSIKAIIRSTTA